MKALFTMLFIAALGGGAWWLSRRYDEMPSLVPQRTNWWAFAGVIIAIVGLVASANGLLSGS